jgi:hypothetical protein
MQKEETTVMRKLISSMFVTVLLVAYASLGLSATAHTFKTMLSGKEVVPAVMTTASGEAVFKLEKDGTELNYKLTVKGLENVTAAHIHSGMKGKSGPPVIPLFAGPKKEGKFSGMLAEGTITAKDLRGALEGKSIEDVVKMIKAGELYVNVHTDAYPNGEIRGQIK